MSGKRWLPEWQRPEIVRAIKAARAAGARWKELEELFGMSERQLRRYVSRETMSDKTSGMSDRGGCVRPAIA